MMMEGTAQDPTNAFVRGVKAHPEPMCILATDQQLLDLWRFCADTSFECSILGVDPTVNCGKFYVTVTTYEPLMLTNVNGKHPAVIGAILIHQQKLDTSYRYLANTIIDCRPSLSGIQAFGTDGEDNLVKWLKRHFQSAIQLQCSVHAEKISKRK